MGFVKLVPAWENPLTVKKSEALSAKEKAGKIKISVQFPKFIYGGVKEGEQYGQIQYISENAVLETVPLVADRTQEKSGIFGRLLGTLVSWNFKKR